MKSAGCTIFGVKGLRIYQLTTFIGSKAVVLFKRQVFGAVFMVDFMRVEKSLYSGQQIKHSMLCFVP